MKTKIELTDEEIILLDGNCSEETQVKVDSAKFRMNVNTKYPSLSPERALLISEIVEHAKENKLLKFMTENIRRCRTCKKDAGYAVYPRSGRNHKKGDKNYDRPRYMTAVDLYSGMVRIKNHVGLGACLECWNEIKDFVKAEIADVKAEMPEQVTGVPKKYKRINNMKCKCCEWEGPESDMGMLPAMMGGMYHGICPNCKAENLLFRTNIEVSKGYTLKELQNV